MCFSWNFFFWIILFRFKPANRKSTFIELTSFKSLFFVNFQVSTLNESQHLLVKLSCESICENLDAFNASSAVCVFSANIAVEKGVIVAVIVIALFIFFLYLPASDVHQHTLSRGGLQTFLSEGRLSSCTTVRGPDILHMSLDMLQSTKSANFSSIY